MEQSYFFSSFLPRQTSTQYTAHTTQTKAQSAPTHDQTLAGGNIDQRLYPAQFATTFIERDLAHVIGRETNTANMPKLVI